MMGLGLIALSILAQPPDTIAVTITSREMNGLHAREDVIRGTCDGRPASATITKAYRGATGRLVLRSGRFAREVPRTFLNGALLTSAFQSVGIGCDGRRLRLHALVLRADARGEIVMDIQDVTLNLRTGELSMTLMRTLSPAETREELD